MQGQRALVLILLMGIVSVQPGAAEGQESPGAFTVDALVDLALLENPDLSAARAEVEAARGRFLQAGFRPNPTLDVAAQQSVTGPDNNIMVGVTLPLDLNGRKAGCIGVAEREIEVKKAQVTNRARELGADMRLKAGEVLAAKRNLRITGELLAINRQEVQAAFVQYEASTRALETYAQGVRDLARQNLEVIRKANQLGRTSLLEVIAEQRRYIEIEMGYTEALQHAYNAVVAMERAVGTALR